MLKKRGPVKSAKRTTVAVAFAMSQLSTVLNITIVGFRKSLLIVITIVGFRKSLLIVIVIVFIVVPIILVNTV